MTLNANYSGARMLAGSSRLDGAARGLDALVGLVIVVAELLIVFIAIYALYVYGVDAVAGTGRADAIQIGFLVALIGGAIVVVVTTVIYLVRLVVGRRSWSAPLWGLILSTAVIVLGWLIMSGGL
jgi:hypothetical protein